MCFKLNNKTHTMWLWADFFTKRLLMMTTAANMHRNQPDRKTAAGIYSYGK